jgi:hypothetical protein
VHDQHLSTTLRKTGSFVDALFAEYKDLSSRDNENELVTYHIQEEEGEMEVMERKGSSPKCASMAGCVSEKEYERHGNMLTHVLP